MGGPIVVNLDIFFFFLIKLQTEKSVPRTIENNEEQNRTERTEIFSFLPTNFWTKKFWEKNVIEILVKMHKWKTATFWQGKIVSMNVWHTIWPARDFSMNIWNASVLMLLFILQEIIIIKMSILLRMRRNILCGWASLWHYARCQVIIERHFSKSKTLQTSPIRMFAFVAHSKLNAIQSNACGFCFFFSIFHQMRSGRVQEKDKESEILHVAEWHRSLGRCRRINKAPLNIMQRPSYLEIYSAMRTRSTVCVRAFE